MQLKGRMEKLGYKSYFPIILQIQPTIGKETRQNFCH